MTTIHAQLLGGRVLLATEDLERLLEVARKVETVEVQLIEDDVPTADLMRLAEQGGAFSFWDDPAEGIYTPADGEPV